jgi:glycosyltransferase involved in cell wall biosynthesis
VRCILSLIPHLEYNGAARQLTLLAAGLPRDRFTQRVCVLGRAGPWAEDLRRAGVEVEVFGWRRWIDPQPLLALHRSLASFRPDVLHAWRLPALRVMALLPGIPRAPLVVSNGLNAAAGELRLDWLDRWLLRRASRVVTRGPAEATQLRALGVREDRIVQVRLAVADVAPGLSRAEVCGRLGLPRDGRLLVAVGPLNQHKGFRDAIWAFDLLRHPYGELHLVLIGGGPERQRLERFARTTQGTDRVHFVGEYSDVPALLARAEAVWVPSRADTGHNVALEAMAAGCPVVASRWPGLADIIVAGETGFLIRPGDKAALARQTRRLLDDGDLRQRLGEAARQRAADHFSPAAAVARLAELYEAVHS